MVEEIPAKKKQQQQNDQKPKSNINSKLMLDQTKPTNRTHISFPSVPSSQKTPFPSTSKF